MTVLKAQQAHASGCNATCGIGVRGTRVVVVGGHGHGHADGSGGSHADSQGPCRDATGSRGTGRTSASGRTSAAGTRTSRASTNPASGLSKCAGSQQAERCSDDEFFHRTTSRLKRFCVCGPVWHRAGRCIKRQGPWQFFGPSACRTSVGTRKTLLQPFTRGTSMPVCLRQKSTKQSVFSRATSLTVSSAPHEDDIR